MRTTVTLDIPDINLLRYANDSSSPFHVKAAGHVRSWLEQPPVQVLDPGPDHIRHTLQLLENLGTAGNLVSDAQMAALALDHDVALHTADSDFVRFQGLRWFNPMTGTGNASLRRTKLS